MSKLGKVVLSATAITITLGFLHAWLNLGFDPLARLGLKEAEETRFRVGFLPVT
jgi:hypothetical protein